MKNFKPLQTSELRSELTALCCNVSIKCFTANVFVKGESKPKIPNNLKGQFT